MKKAMLSIVIVFSLVALAQAEEEKATVHAVYDLVLKAHEVVSVLGEDSFAAFNDPKGEFVHKEIYAYVLNCPSEMVAHPFAIKALAGKDLTNSHPFITDICKAGDQPSGGWMDYSWPKPGETEPSRKVAFAVKLEGSNYTVVSSIYSESANVEELNKNLR